MLKRFRSNNPSLKKIPDGLYLNVAKVGGLQSQGVKGEAVFVYRKPLTTQDLKSSGFPVGPLARGPKGQQQGKNDPIL
jgi:hypothetical protein